MNDGLAPRKGPVFDDEFNPYAAPKSLDSGPPPGPVGDDMVIVGKALVVFKGTVLPPLCVRTGVKVEGRPLKADLSHAPSWLLVLLLLNLLIGAIFYFFVVKRATVLYFIAPKERSKRAWASVGAGFLFVAAVCMLVFGLWDGVSALVLVALLAFVAAGWAGFGPGRGVSAEKIDKHRVWVRGIAPDVMLAMVALSRSGDLEFEEP